MQQSHRQHILTSTTSSAQEQTQKLYILLLSLLTSGLKLHIDSSLISTDYLVFSPIDSPPSPSTLQPLLPLHEPPPFPTTQLPINESLSPKLTNDNPQASDYDFTHQFNHQGISRSHLCLRHPSLSRSRCDAEFVPQYCCCVLVVHSHQLDPGSHLWRHLALEMGAQTQQKNMQESCGGSDGCWRSCF
jgi:hypothetical protein